MTEDIKIYKCNLFKKNGYTDNIIIRYIKPCEEDPLLKPYGLGKPKEGYFRMRVMKQNAETKEFCDSDIVEVTQEFIDDFMVKINYKELTTDEIIEIGLV